MERLESQMGFTRMIQKEIETADKNAD